MTAANVPEVFGAKTCDFVRSEIRVTGKVCAGDGWSNHVAGKSVGAS